MIFLVRFGFYQKKSNQIKILKKKTELNRNRVKPTGFGLVLFFRAKTGSNRFSSVFPVLARFFRFSSVFFLFFFGFGSVWFFQFSAYKTEPNRPVFSKF
jgi:hypothetical protein